MSGQQLRRCMRSSMERKTQLRLMERAGDSGEHAGMVEAVRAD